MPAASDRLAAPLITEPYKIPPGGFVGDCTLELLKPPLMPIREGRVRAAVSHAVNYWGAENAVCTLASPACTWVCNSDYFTYTDTERRRIPTFSGAEANRSTTTQADVSTEGEHDTAHDVLQTDSSAFEINPKVASDEYRPSNWRRLLSACRMLTARAVR
jgi:hypothetical protein